MSKPKIYIAGKVSGLPFAETTAKFGLAQVQLEKQGFEVVNPLAVVSEVYGKEPREYRHLRTPWDTCMRWCISAMMECDAVVLLSDWPLSKGAALERYIAAEVRMPIFMGTNDKSLYVWQEACTK